MAHKGRSNPKKKQAVNPGNARSNPNGSHPWSHAIPTVQIGDGGFKVYSWQSTFLRPWVSTRPASSSEMK